MNIVDTLTLLKSLYHSDVVKLKKLYESPGSNINISDIVGIIRNSALRLPKIGFSNEMIKYLCSIEFTGRMGGDMICCMVCKTISIDRISKVLEHNPHIGYTLQQIIHIYKYNNDINIYYKDVLNMILNYCIGKVNIDDLKLLIQENIIRTYKHNDVILYMVFNLLGSEELSKLPSDIITILVEMVVQNNMNSDRMNMILKYIPDSQLNSQEYRDAIKKLNKSNTYISLFEEDI